MVKFNRPCTRCGELTRESICIQCRRLADRRKPRNKNKTPTTTPKERGYDSKWRRLSERARSLQPWCTDCGSKTDLQADHSPAAWERYEKGLPLRLVDVEVVCGVCNRKRGAARGEDAERASNGPESQSKDGPHEDA